MLSCPCETDHISVLYCPLCIQTALPFRPGGWEYEVEAAIEAVHRERDEEPGQRGEDVERKAVSVTIHSFELVDNISAQSEGTTDIPVRVVCSAGTYVRTLAEDFGKRLGVGAHVAALRRTKAGEFDLKRAITLEQLEASMRQSGLGELLVTPDVALEFLPYVSLDSIEMQRTQQGLPLKLGSKGQRGFDDAGWVRMRDEAGTLVAVGTYDLEADAVEERVAGDLLPEA